jgi:hypothetical protein
MENPFRVDILEGVSEDNRKGAAEAISQREKEILPALSYTEAEPRWVLLYDHARRGQIRPEKIRRMYRADLEYLAGMAQPHEQLSKDEAAKLLGNVARAARQLQVRNSFWIGAVSALLGATIGSLVTALAT